MRCLVVSLSQDGLTALSPPCQTMRKVLDNIGVVTGKTAEKQGKCTLGLFPRAYSCLYTLHPTLYTLLYGQTGRTEYPPQRGVSSLITIVPNPTHHAYLLVTVASELDQ